MIKMREMDETMVYEEHTLEYKKLELATAVMSFVSPNKKKYHVDNTWRDVDAGIAWTTILGESGMKSFPEYQALSYKEQQALLACESEVEIMKYAEDFIFGKTRTGRDM